MTNYEKLMIMAEVCLDVARAYQVLKENDMVKFWNNAHYGFIKKARNLKYEEL